MGFLSAGLMLPFLPTTCSFVHALGLTLNLDGNVCMSFTERLRPMRVAMLQCCTVGVKCTLQAQQWVNPEIVLQRLPQGAIQIQEAPDCHNRMVCHILSEKKHISRRADLTMPSLSFTVIASSLTTLSCSKV